MEDFTNIYDIKQQIVPARRAPLPPSKAQMSKQSSNQSRYGILSSKIFQPNLRRQNAVKKKSAPPRPPPPVLNNVVKSQSIPSLGVARNVRSNNLISRNAKLKPTVSEACLIDLSSPPNSPYAGSGSDGVSVNSFGSENSSNNHSASEDVFDPFGLICEEPQTTGFSSFYNGTQAKATIPTVKRWDDDDPFKEIALRHEHNTRPQAVKCPNNSVRINNTIPKLPQPTQSVKSTFYAQEESSKPLRTTIIRPKSQSKVTMSASTSEISKSVCLTTSENEGQKNFQEYLAEVIHDFNAAEPGDLSVKVGQKVMILRQINDDWLYGKTSLSDGMFPKSFVQVVSSEAAESTTRVSHCPDSSKVFAKALYTFAGEVGEDLSFQEGEDICILGKINDDWLYGESRGSQGQFPANFVDTVPANLPPWVAPS